MRDQMTFEDPQFVTLRFANRARPGSVLLAAAVTSVISAAVCAAAVLIPAPAAAVPLVVIICIGCPIFAGWEVPVALASLRTNRAAGRAVATLRGTLDQLPETEHPLGL